MSTRYEDFLPEVLPYVRDCPEIVAINAIRNSCIEFCDRSLWLLYHHDPVDIIGGESTYELDLPDGTTTARILDAWYNNTPLAPIGEDDLKTMFNMDWREATGDPRFYTHLDPIEVVLAPTPQADADEALSMIMALRPSRDSVDVDDSLFERWVEYISYGARARLHEIPAQPFSDPASAMKSRQMFNHGIGLATIERNRGLTRHVMRVRMPRAV
jgi:hypothetical protein